jgi:hypothetical protein
VRDAQKAALSCFAFVAMVTVPWVVLLTVWAAFNWRAGLIAAVATGLAFFLIGSLSLVLMRQPSLWMSGFPLLAGLLYTWFPDFIPFGFDDTAVFSAGALMSAGLWFRHDRELGRRLFLPLAGAALYTLIGSFIPGPVDEIIVQGLILGIPITRLAIDRRNHPRLPVLTTAEVVEGEIVPPASAVDS